MVFYPFDLKPDGPTVGGHIGYSLQNGPWVYGIEGDVSGVFNAHARAFDPAGSGRYDEIEVLWTAHIRGRLGHLLSGDCLIYVAGGLALAGVKASHFAPGVQLWSQTDVRTGYSVGGGVEKAFGNWRLRAEYLFDGFASKRFDWVAGTRYSNSDLSLHTGRVGFSYLFGR
jgi:outer membrane immunogenic protein